MCGYVKAHNKAIKNRPQKRGLGSLTLAFLVGVIFFHGVTQIE